MSTLGKLYRDRLALLTDLYQLTMAYGYWKSGWAEREAVFHLIFRRCPFEGEYAVSCGLATAIEWLEQFRFDREDLDYLATLTGRHGEPLFEESFLRYLDDMKFGCSVDAAPEGTVVFAHAPTVRVRGPLLQAQLLETPLLTLLNFPTLAATKAARVCSEAQGDPVLEFGLRRAQGIDGGVTASRAAYVGGCVGTSNVLAGKLYGIPVRGTHAHSWVMAFDDELAAFSAYADAMPDNCVFLVDTYNTLAGVRHAVQVGQRLRQRGFEMIGVRLDSGDLAELSQAARRILDDGGFPDAVIVGSNDLDEYLIRDLKQQGSRVNTWGVGTRLATCFEQPALGGVYKLSALRSDDGRTWQHKLKLSEQPIKISTPGILQVRRYHDGSVFLGDAVYDELTGTGTGDRVIDFRTDLRHDFSAAKSHEDILVPVFREGQRVYSPPPLSDVRARTQSQLAQLRESTRRLLNPTPYPVGLESDLHALKQRLVEKVRQETLRERTT